MSRLTRDGRPNPSRETKFSGANGDREMLIFPVEAGQSYITRLILILTIAICVILTIAICVTILKPKGIRMATKYLPGTTTRGHRKLHDGVFQYGLLSNVLPLFKI